MRYPTNRSTNQPTDTASYTLGVFLVMTKNAFVPVKRDNSVNTYSRISTVPRGSERSEWASPWMERSEAERCGASERSERCERTNVARDRVALSKRNRLWLETPPESYSVYTRVQTLSHFNLSWVTMVTMVVMVLAEDHRTGWECLNQIEKTVKYFIPVNN